MKIRAEVQYLAALEWVENVKASLEDAGGDPAAATVSFVEAIVDNDDAAEALGDAGYFSPWGEHEPDPSVIDDALFVEAFSAVAGGDFATARALLGRCCNDTFHRSLEDALDATAARAPAWSA